MCGICGKISFNGESISPELIRSMCAAIARRGPDDMGIFLSEGNGSGVQVGLGHQRLSIIDLSAAGRQPMANEDGNIRLTYNGEIYNSSTSMRRRGRPPRGG
jgi:asparagine synthase (glutamine-hydrolysing)